MIGHQRQPGTPLWVRMTDADVARWDGSASLGADMYSLPEATAELGITAEELRGWVRDGRLLTFRVRVGKRWRWLVRVPE